VASFTTFPMVSKNPKNPTALILSTSEEDNGRLLKDYIARQTALLPDEIGFRGPNELRKLTNGARLISEKLRLVIVHAIRPLERGMALGLATDMSERLSGAEEELNQVVLYGPLWGNLGRGEQSYLERKANNGFVDSVRPYYGDNGSKHMHLIDWFLQRGVDLSSNNGQSGILASTNAPKHLLVTDHRDRWENELTKLWSDQAGIFRSRIDVRDLAGEGSVSPEELVDLCRQGLGNVLIHLTNPDYFDQVLDLIESVDAVSEGEASEINSSQIALRLFFFSETIARLFPDVGERNIAQEFVSNAGVPHAQRDPSWSLDGEIPKELKSWMKGKG
jgi:hypothetical protein